MPVFHYLRSGGAFPVPSGNLPSFSLCLSSLPPPAHLSREPGTVFSMWQRRRGQAAVRSPMVGCPLTEAAPVCPRTGRPQVERGIQMWSHECGWRWVITFLGLPALLQGDHWSNCCQGPLFYPLSPKLSCLWPFLLSGCAGIVTRVY